MTTKNKMGTLVSTTNPGTQDGITLRTMVNRLVAGIVPSFARQNSFMVNEIPWGLKVEADPGVISAVLGKLFATIATHAENSCIRISSKDYGYLLVVQLRNNNNTNPYTIAGSLQEIIPLAEQIGGYIGISSQEDRGMTIVFSFSNVLLAA
ncbi:MAG: hypothetical protein ABIR30_04140 [Chitinophagaceae bacterium]